MQTAIFLLVIASLAALQSRAIRGAKRHQLQDICHQKGLPDVYDELVRASEGVAFLLLQSSCLQELQLLFLSLNYSQQVFLLDCGQVFAGSCSLLYL